MVGRVLVACLATCACGRIGFDPPGPTLDLDFTRGDATGIRVERATPGTYVDDTGVIRLAAADTPRFDHDPMTGAPLGLLVEGDRTNILRGRSAELEFGPAWFSNGNTEIAVDVAIAPDGTMSAEEVTDVETGGIQRRAAIFSLPDDDLTYTYSVFLRAGTSSTCALAAEILGGSRQVQIAMNVDLSRGEITEAPGTPYFGIEPYPGGWYRVWLAITNTFSQNDYGLLSIWGDLDDDTRTGSVFAWGAQVEVGASPSSYIPADDGEAPRAADIVRTIDTDWLVPGQGTLQVAASVTDGNTAPHAAVCLTAGARACLGRTSAGLSALAVGATDDKQLDATSLVGASWPRAISHTTIATWDRASTSLGTATSTALIIPSEIDEVRIGGAPALGGHVLRLVYWPYRSDMVGPR